MRIVQYEPTHADALTRLYNEVVAGLVPRCYPVTTETLSSELSGTSADPENLIHSEQVLTAVRGREPVAFAHLAIGRKDRGDNQEHGHIRFLCCRHGDRDVGAALLKKAEGYFKGQKVSDSIAFWHYHKYPFYYRESACLSDRLGHVAAWLGLNGYRPIRGEIMMEMPNYTPADILLPEIAVELREDLKPGHGKLPDLDLKVYLGQREVGTCTCVSCAQYGEDKDLDEWWLPEWLGLEDEVQGKGVGRFLLRTALRRMHDRGYRHAAISTDEQNYRAACLYTSEGYRVIDRTHAYAKDLD